MRGKSTLFSAAVVLLILSSPVFAYQQVVDLGVISGGHTSYAYSINDDGQVVGSSTISNGNINACLFDQTSQNAKSLCGNESYAYSINNAGQIVGRAKFLTGLPPTMHVTDHACFFDSKNILNNKDLGSLGGSISGARSINNNNQIVGYAYNSSERPRACLFDSSGNGANIDLGTLGGTDSTAYAVNDNGIIVGSAYLNDNDPPYMTHACLFDSSGNGANIDLGTPGGNYSYAFSINNSNQIVGRAGGHACLFDWTGGGANIDLGTLGGLQSEAWFINDISQIVGWAYDSSNNKHACLFDPTGKGNIDLNNLIDPSSGWVLREAYSINESGWIVGNGYRDGYTRAFLLTPEPATLLLFGLGGLILRKRKSY
jgi:probable HAF family extracellular repeat protein